MTDQPTAVVETPKRKIRVHLPSKQTLQKVAIATGGVVLGAAVMKRKLAGDCACESDTTNAGDQSTD